MYFGNDQRVYEALCVIEYDIMNEKIDLDKFNEVIRRAITEKIDEMPRCILIKIF